MLMNKKFIYILTLIIFVLTILLIVNIYNQKNTKTEVDLNNSWNSYSSLNIVSYPNIKDDINDKTLIYKNINLPNFAIEYKSSWTLAVKEFKEPNIYQFKSKYFPKCEANCMGVKLSKNNIDLTIIFDLALDDSSKICSNKVTYQEIGNGWLRVKNDGGYFYTKNYQFNVITKDDEPFTIGDTNQEWSLLNKTNYKICINGTGYFRSESKNIYNLESNPKTLVENPIVEGNPSESILKEIDEIIKTLN